MPTYQYACTNPECGNDFELVQSFTEPAATECPDCGQLVRKRFGSVGVVFKGSGFYRTDSRAESKSRSQSPTQSSSNGAGKSDKADSAAAKSESTSSSSSSGESKTPAASGSGSSGRVAASA